MTSPMTTDKLRQRYYTNSMAESQQSDADLEGGGSMYHANNSATTAASSSFLSPLRSGTSGSSNNNGMEIPSSFSSSGGGMNSMAYSQQQRQLESSMYDGGKGRRVKSSGAFSFAGGSNASLNLLSPRQYQTLQSLLHRLIYNPSIANDLPKVAVALFVVLVLLFPFCSVAYGILLCVGITCGFGTIVALWLCQDVLKKDDGTPEMKQVSEPIREGAQGFLQVQYTAIARIAIPLSIMIFISYQFRPNVSTHSDTGVAVLGNVVLGLVAAMAFGIGAVCSAVAGYLSMAIASMSNIRVAAAGRTSYAEALIVCFRGGAFSAVLNLTLCVAGVTTLYVFLMILFATSLSIQDIPILMVGYGFGASFVALFMQLVRIVVLCRVSSQRYIRIVSNLHNFDILGRWHLHKSGRCRCRFSWESRTKYSRGRSAQPRHHCRFGRGYGGGLCRFFGRRF
jgi:Inorganic H+ pyrophosphatase